MYGNDLNVFTYGYLPWTYWKNWFRNIKQFFRNIKYAWQRAIHGYCNQDIWNLDSYYTCLIRDSINRLADTTHGYPGEYELVGKTFEDWQQYLYEISLLLDKSIERTFEDNQYYRNKYEKKYQEYLADPSHFITTELPNGSYKLEDTDTEVDKILKTKYFKEEKKIYTKRLQDRNKAIDMLKSCWDNLWD